MAFILGGTCKCPRCGGHQFVSTNKLGDDDKLTCSTAGCGYVCTVKEAKAAELAKPKPGGSENLVDK